MAPLLHVRMHRNGTPIGIEGAPDTESSPVNERPGRFITVKGTGPFLQQREVAFVGVQVRGSAQVVASISTVVGSTRLPR